MDKWKLKTTGQTFDEDSRKVACDVLGHSEGVPWVNGTVREDDASALDVISSVFLIGLLNNFVQWGAEIIYVSALLQVITEGRQSKTEESWSEKKFNMFVFMHAKKNPKPLMQLQTNIPTIDGH